MKKGTDDTYIYQKLIKLSNVEYEYIYKTYLLILKNILHFIWSFEYNILKDKNKLTKFYVIDDNDLDLGYHIYTKNKNEYNPYDTFSKNKNLNLINSDIFVEKIDLGHDRYDAVYESIQVLSNVIMQIDQTFCIYVKNKENKALNILDINEIQKKVCLCYWPVNNTASLKPEISQEYFSELNLIIVKIKEEWKINGELNIYEKRDVFKELVKHITEKKS